jgi:hypothetical protein
MANEEVGKTRRVFQSAAFGLALAALAVACGGGHMAAPKAAGNSQPKAVAAVPAEVHERIAPRTCGTRTKLAALLGQSAPAEVAPAEQSAESVPPEVFKDRALGPRWKNLAGTLFKATSVAG